MRILVFSDSHGNPGTMFRAVKDHLEHGGVDMILHLGDGYRDFTALEGLYPDIPSYMVMGNCDEGAAINVPKERIIEIDGFTFHF